MAMPPSRHSTFAHKVAALVERLGAQLVAYIGDAEETHTVAQWIAVENLPHEMLPYAKMYFVFNLTEMLIEAGEGEVMQAWFQGMNPYLDDRSPIQCIHDAQTSDDLARLSPEILAAVHAFCDL
jgi:hypothetical protein